MDELTLLRATRSDIDGPTDAALAAGRTTLEQRWAPSPARQGAAAPRHRALITAAIATVALVAVTVGVTGIGPKGASAQAAEVLEQAALASIASSDPVVPAGHYLEVESMAEYAQFVFPDGVDQSNHDNEMAFRSTVEESLFIPADRSDSWVWVRGPHVFAGWYGEPFASEQLKEAAEKPAPSPETLRAKNGVFYSGRQVTEAELDALPLDAHELYAHFEDAYVGGSASREEDIMVKIADILQTSRASADLRAALYRTLALIPGMEIVEDEANLAGEEGVAFGREDPNRGDRFELIIDPANGQFIGERNIALVPYGNIPVGAVYSSEAITTTVVPEAP